MNNELADLKMKWQEARKNLSVEASDTASMLARARKRKRSSVLFQFGNVLVLALTLAGISLFFIYLAPLRTDLGRTGIVLMIGSLVLRVLTEIYSIWKARKIDLTQSAAGAVEKTLTYAEFRRRINGPLTIATLVFYNVGVLLIIPEISRYVAMTWLSGFLLAYLLFAVMFTLRIRREISKEQKNLREMADIKQELETQ